MGGEWGIKKRTYIARLGSTLAFQLDTCLPAQVTEMHFHDTNDMSCDVGLNLSTKYVKYFEDDRKSEICKQSNLLRYTCEN